ncbi:unnamed protein product [Rotaria sp. Silwood2]|nr:unnamed protein product [Rotaria sp. Silwood2]
MEYSCVGLNDLPDEILMIIFKKLNNFDVLYSLHGVNQRLNKLIQDSIFTNRLTFVKCFLYNFIDLISSDMILNRFCLQILPEICHKIKRLDLESSSMKYVLRAAHYPNLYCLGLYNINEESARCLFTDEILSSGIFKNQIKMLLITMDKNDDYYEMISSVENICNYIFNILTRLTSLTLYETSYRCPVRLNFYNPLPFTIFSSTILILNVRVQCFEDCLYLLDGRFNQLHTLYVDLVNIHCPRKLKNQGDLPNLRCFSLSCNYDAMDSSVSIDNEMHLPSGEDIQRTFIDFINNEIISYVDYFPETKQTRCHIYSYPSFMPYYGFITNNFPGGLFKYVRMVSLYDEYPFEHEFFLRVVQSFPYMEQLYMCNRKSQNCKQSYELSNDNQNLSVTEYFFLSELRIINVHDDYIEEFLFDTKACLPHNVILYIKYESLQRVTDNFTRDATRINCAKIVELYLCSEPQHSNSLQGYFPNAKISFTQKFLC